MCVQRDCTLFKTSVQPQVRQQCFAVACRTSANPRPAYFKSFLKPMKEYKFKAKDFDLSKINYKNEYEKQKCTKKSTKVIKKIN